MLKKLNNLKTLVVGGLVSTAVMVGNSVSAAADSDFAAVAASSTALITDNKTQIISFIVGIAVATLGIGLAVIAINKGKAAILGAFAGRRRKK